MTLDELMEKYRDLGPPLRTPQTFADAVGFWLYGHGYATTEEVGGLKGELGGPGEIVVTLPRPDLEEPARQAWIEVAPRGTQLTIKLASGKEE